MPRRPASQSNVVDEANDVISSLPDEAFGNTPVDLTGLYPLRPARANRANHPKATQVVQGGKLAFTYHELLDLAYDMGFVRFAEATTQVFVVPSPSGKGDEPLAVVTVAAEFRNEDGTTELHYGTGDAAPSNATVKLHYVRMAETRARSRALIAAMNIDANAEEEFGGNTTESNNVTPIRQSTRAAAPARQSSGQGEDPSQFPPPNNDDGDGWVCEECGEDLKDTAKSSAGRKAQWAMQKTGQILCWDHQQKALGN